MKAVLHFLSAPVTLPQWELLVLWILNGTAGGATALWCYRRRFEKRLNEDVQTFMGDYRARWEQMITQGQAKMRELIAEEEKRRRRAGNYVNRRGE